MYFRVFINSYKNISHVCIFFSLKWDCYGLSFSLGCNHNFAMLHSSCSSVPGRLPAGLEKCRDVPWTVGGQVGARTSHMPQAQYVLQ
uniref:Uncharacterized protein n=1 Tax=Anser brachyrhynchus TaxID=132585 RepID=A0A8B9IAJ5_9AVES